MTDVQYDGGTAYEMVIEGRSEAPAAAVYDVLADPSTHLAWAGGEQHRNFRLLSMNGSGPLRAGAEFTSVGSIPMALSRWEDHNEVVEARAPNLLEFITDGVVVWRSGKRSEVQWEHRYEIVPEGTGSRVTYRLRRTAMENPPRRMSVPLMRSLTHRVMIPYFCRRGFDNLLRSAARRNSTSGATRAVA